MSKFKKIQEKENPQISTASLPDIVFMLLFFFMVVTVMKERDKLVDITLPKASEINQIKNPRKTDHLYIGNDLRYQNQNITKIQINDKFVPLNKVQASLTHPEKTDDVVALQIDKGITMGLVTDVKTEIRKANRLKINYISQVRP